MTARHSARRTKLLVSAVRRPLVAFAVAVISALAFIVAGFLYYGSVGSRAIVVSGATESLTPTFDVEQIWLLAGVTACTARPPRRASLPPLPSEPPCGDGEEVAGRWDVLEILWQAGTTLTLRRVGTGVLTILVESIGEGDQSIGEDGARVGLRAGDRLVVAGFGEGASRTLLLRGTIELGAPVATGATAVLQDARYEFRERLPLASTSTLVREGALLPGDAVSFENAAGPVRVEGFVTPEQPARNGLRFVVVSGDPAAALLVERPGAVPFRIATAWSDRAIADPLAIALTAIAGVFLVVVTLVVELRNLIGTEPSAHERRPGFGTDRAERSTIGTAPDPDPGAAPPSP